MTEVVEDRPLVPPSWLERESNIPLTQAAKIAGPSVEGLRRHYSKYIKRLGEKRDFMKLKHALAIADGTIQAEKQPT